MGGRSAEALPGSGAATTRHSHRTATPSPPFPRRSLGGVDKQSCSKLFIAGLRGHTDAVTGLAWSPDGASLATACEDRTVRVYDLRDPTAKSIPMRKKELLRAGVLDVGFGADSNHVVLQVGGWVGVWGVGGVAGSGSVAAAGFCCPLLLVEGGAERGWVVGARPRASEHQGCVPQPAPPSPHAHPPSARPPCTPAPTPADQGARQRRGPGAAGLWAQGAAGGLVGGGHPQ